MSNVVDFIKRLDTKKYKDAGLDFDKYEKYNTTVRVALNIIRTSGLFNLLAKLSCDNINATGTELQEEIYAHRTLQPAVAALIDVVQALNLNIDSIKTFGIVDVKESAEDKINNYDIIMFALLYEQIHISCRMYFFDGELDNSNVKELYADKVVPKIEYKDLSQESTKMITDFFTEARRCNGGINTSNQRYVYNYSYTPNAVCAVTLSMRDV